MMQSVGIASKPGYRRARFGVSSKSSGYLKTKSTKARSNKKYRQRSPFINNGVTQVFECGGTVTGSASALDTIYVGHSFGLYSMKYNAWWSVLREVFIMAGVRVDDFAKSAVFTSGLSVPTGTLISVSYRADADSNLTSFGYNIGVTDTVDYVIKQFVDNFNTKPVLFYDLGLQPVVDEGGISQLNRVQLRLDQTMIHFDMKADLKIQNRTVNVVEADNQSDDINNCPIYGKSIEGKANGAEVIGMTSGNNYSLAANERTGLIQMTPAVDELAEPLDYQRFKPVSKIGKIHLDPGQIKTSVLTKKFKISFNKFFNAFNPQAAPATNVDVGKMVYNPYVKYRVFALEKMLDANPGASKTPVIVAVENNVRIFSRVTQWKRYVTNVAYFKANLQ